VIAAQGNLGAQRNFFQKLAVSTDRRNAEIGAAEINPNGEIRHGVKDYQNDTANSYCGFLTVEGSIENLAEPSHSTIKNQSWLHFWHLGQ
jgi:hypothetical protein